MCTTLILTFSLREKELAASLSLGERRTRSASEGATPLSFIRLK
jgi:hypothetical protein